MMNVMTMVRSFETPIRVAVSGSCATARMPRPVRLRRMNRSVPTMSSTAATTMMICWLVMIVPNTSKIGVGMNIVTAGCALPPPMELRKPRPGILPILGRMKMMYWIAKETPIAVIRNARRGALRLRSGR